MSALFLQMLGTSFLHWLQSAQISWLGLCGPETNPQSTSTSLPALMECHADDEQMLFHPFSLVGCQGGVNILPSFQDADTFCGWGQRGWCRVNTVARDRRGWSGRGIEM